MKDVFIHKTAQVEDGARIGKGSKIWDFCKIRVGAKLGKNCNLGQNVYVAPNVKIGNNVKIQNNVSVYEGVVLKDDVFCGPSCVFSNVKTFRSAVNRKDKYGRTTVNKGATIGANATIVCDISIGEHAVIGAGAVVTKNVKKFAIVAGNPARQIGWACRCGESLKDLKCHRCKSEYKLVRGYLRPA